VGAQLVPLDGIYAFGRAIADLPRDRDLVFVCEVGQRSGVASEIALVAGFAPDHVYNLMGGTALWRRQNLPLER
jgi:rhodanese-related sulfurtransferase